MDHQRLRDEMTAYVEKNIGAFHQKRLQNLEVLKLDSILRRKNPYLFRAKNLLTAEVIVTSLLNAYLSSQEETLFGEFLEGLALCVCGVTKGCGYKSAAEGIDLEFTEDNVRYLITIKSGPNWGNSSQIAKMRDNFRKAKKIYGSNNPNSQVIAINGCCYGRDDSPDKGAFLKLCGQRFWHFLSGDPNLYKDIIAPIGHKAKEKNEEFLLGYSKIINRFTEQFHKRFVRDGEIEWGLIVEFNSGAVSLPRADFSPEPNE